MVNKTQNLKLVDLSKILKPYENKWVALSLDYKKVLGSGKTLKEAKKEADEAGEKYLFLKVFPFDISYVPAN